MHSNNSSPDRLPSLRWRSSSAGSWRALSAATWPGHCCGRASPPQPAAATRSSPRHLCLSTAGRPAEALHEVLSLHEAPDRTVHERVDPPHGGKYNASAHRRGQVWCQVDVEPPAGFGQGASSSCAWKNDSPSGFMASVIICWWPNDMYTWFLPSWAPGIGNSVVIGRLWTIVERRRRPERPLDVLGAAEVGFDRRPSRPAAGPARRSASAAPAASGSISVSSVPPPGDGDDGEPLGQTTLVDDPAVPHPVVVRRSPDRRPGPRPARSRHRSRPPCGSR